MSTIYTKMPKLKKIYFATAFLLISLSAVCQDNPFKKGDELMAVGSFRAAAIYYDSLLITQPQNRTYCLLRARALGLAGDHEQSGNVMDSVLKSAPDDKGWLISRAELWLWQKQPLEAIKILTVLYQADPENEGVLFNYCNALIAAGQFTAGLPLLQAIKMKKEGKSPWPEMQKNLRIGYSLQLRAAENYLGAIRQIDTILMAIPNDPGSLLLRGDLLLQSKRFGDAVTNYARIVPLNFEKNYGTD